MKIFRSDGLKQIIVHGATDKLLQRSNKSFSNSFYRFIWIPFLYSCTFPYRFGFLFDQWRKQFQLQRIQGAEKVISVGNITWGGTGKTPFVMAFSLECLKNGIFPIILSKVLLSC